jgi:diguanylate cyclase (GGDEF)-like protein
MGITILPEKKDDGSEKGLAIKTGLSILIASILYLLIVGGFCLFSNGPVNKIKVEDCSVQTTVIRTDRAEEKSRSMIFHPISKDDKVIIDFVAPDTDFVNPSLYFCLYNTGVRVTCDNEEIYNSSVEDLKPGRNFGNRIFCIPLPYDSEGKHISVEITQNSYRLLYRVDEMYVISGTDSGNMILEGKHFYMITFVALFVMSVLMLLFFLIRTLATGKLQNGSLISLFSMLISFWYMANSRLLYLLTSNTTFCSTIEYPTLLLAPVPLALMVYLEVQKKSFKLMDRIFTWLYTVFFVVAMIINNSKLDYCYSDIMPFFHVLLIAGIVSFAMQLFVERGEGKAKAEKQPLHVGLVVGMLVTLFEVFRLYTADSLSLLIGSDISIYSLAPIAILILVFTFMYYTIMRATKAHVKRVEKEQLEILAYRDQLTGIPNRTSVYKDIEAMNEKGIIEYTMFFVDVNGLKQVNDNYGHEAGDLLIKTAAKAVDTAFNDPANGFCGRWGGDEFVACVFGSTEKANEKEKVFHDTFEELKAKEDVPFVMESAIGRVRCTKALRVDPIQAIDLADQAMYKKKIQMKKERNAELKR